jgi:Leucine-rich repeat (LRR) protein
MSDCGLSSLPSDLIAQIREPQSTLAPLIKNMDISNNNLSRLPIELGRLTQLKRFIISDNRLQHWSDADCAAIFTCMTQLQMLDLHGNRLMCLPRIMFTAHHRQLQTLNVSKNQLTALPDSVLLLTELVVLDASENKIVQLPEEGWGQLKKLEELNLDQNQLVRIPDKWSQLDQLVTLKLEKNRINAFPAAILKNERLSTLNLDQNPFTMRQLMELDGFEEVDC